LALVELQVDVGVARAVVRNLYAHVVAALGKAHRAL